MRNEPASFRNDKAMGRDAASRLASIFAKVLRLPLDRIHPDLGPNDVRRWDSVGHVALVLAIEEEFSIDFEANDIMEFTSFRTILSAVERSTVSSPADIGPAERIA